MQNKSKSGIFKIPQADTVSEIEGVSAAPYSSNSKNDSFYLPTFFALQQKQTKFPKVSARAGSSKTENCKFFPPTNLLPQQNQRLPPWMNAKLPVMNATLPRINESSTSKNDKDSSSNHKRRPPGSFSQNEPKSRHCNHFTNKPKSRLCDHFTNKPKSRLCDHFTKETKESTPASWCPKNCPHWHLATPSDTISCWSAYRLHCSSCTSCGSLRRSSQRDARRWAFS